MGLFLKKESYEHFPDAPPVFWSVSWRTGEMLSSGGALSGRGLSQEWVNLRYTLRLRNIFVNRS